MAKLLQGPLRNLIRSSELLPLTASAPLARLSSAAGQMEPPPVLFDSCNGIGHVRLNRPKALNSLNTPMVVLMQDMYNRCIQPKSGINCIVLTGEGGKAFCAGGDVKFVVQEAAAGRPQIAANFFNLEYTLNATIGGLRIPHIALLDGIVMGGGAGVSMHGHFRVATEKTLFAMPEVGIGLFPDVGMMHRLVQLPGALGNYLALTGARITGSEVKEAGLATHYIPSLALPEVLNQLHQLGPKARDLSVVNAVLTDAESQAAAAAAAAGGAPSKLQQQLPSINKAFGSHHRNVGEVLQELDKGTWDKEWSSSTHKGLLKGSPLSAAVTWRYLRLVREQSMTLDQVLAMDRILATHFSYGKGDFLEGVRARLIDKDDKPKWKHASVDEVPEEELESFFGPGAYHDQQTQATTSKL